MLKRLSYWNRIVKAYLLPSTSQLTFWHGTPEVNPRFNTEQPGPYYMKFQYKADYHGDFDENGIPMLNYHGDIGLQYNPIAIAQYGLGNYNLYMENNEDTRYWKFLTVADWLVKSLEPNTKGIPVWHHYFDFEYRDTLKAPWYSGLAQGLGISVLLRAHDETGNEKYVQAANDAFKSIRTHVEDGGVQFKDDDDIWLEEYIVDPPTHILNGFIWGLWGVYDMAVYQSNNEARDLFNRFSKTIIKNLHCYDNGFWSLYEQSGTLLPMIASNFYHNLHIVQLEIMYTLTGEDKYKEYHERWKVFGSRTLNRRRALVNKTVFKLLYY